ncbi:MAG: rRNA maturation RNase YbeY [Eubacteriaceae bacterium]|nr:rRNA maturation RNase YbeY [Eubacteriaceae bacterium]
MIREIDFDNRCTKEIDEVVYSYVKTAMEATYSRFDFEVGYYVSVSFVDNDEIRELNRTYRNVDSVTDVLSFPMEEIDGRGVELLGDVIICVDRATEQTQELGHSVEREITYLSVHSFLHLLGYDHEEDDDKSEMRALEKEIMAELKIFKNEKTL